MADAALEADSLASFTCHCQGLGLSLQGLGFGVWGLGVLGLSILGPNVGAELIRGGCRVDLQD